MSANENKPKPERIPGPWIATGKSKNGPYFKVRGTRLGRTFKVCNIPFNPDYAPDEEEARLTAEHIASCGETEVRARIQAEQGQGGGELSEAKFQNLWQESWELARSQQDYPAGWIPAPDQSKSNIAMFSDFARIAIAKYCASHPTPPATPLGLSEELTLEELNILSRKLGSAFGWNYSYASEYTHRLVQELVSLFCECRRLSPVQSAPVAPAYYVTAERKPTEADADHQAQVLAFRCDVGAWRPKDFSIVCQETETFTHWFPMPPAPVVVDEEENPSALEALKYMRRFLKAEDVDMAYIDRAIKTEEEKQKGGAK